MIREVNRVWSWGWSGAEKGIFLSENDEKEKGPTKYEVEEVAAFEIACFLAEHLAYRRRDEQHLRVDKDGVSGRFRHQIRRCRDDFSHTSEIDWQYWLHDLAEIERSTDLPSPRRASMGARRVDAISLAGGGLETEQSGTDELLHEQVGPSFSSGELIKIGTNQHR